MVESTQILLQQFKAKKAEKDSTSLQEARRLVNLYRSLSCFGDDFMQEYNQMLLSAKPNVRRLLGTFMGGKEVEDYLEFLEQNAHLSASEKGEEEVISTISKNKGYLPEPDSDMGILKTNGTISVSEAEWKKMKEQNEVLAKKTQDLLDVVKKLEEKEKGTFQISGGTSSATRPSSFENYSEILEDIAGGKADE